VVNAVRQLEQVNAHVIGGVLNNFDISGASPYDYNYGYAPAVDSATATATATSRFRLRKQARY
jgi:hypothetical protein